MCKRKANFDNIRSYIPVGEAGVCQQSSPRYDGKRLISEIESNQKYFVEDSAQQRV